MSAADRGTMLPGAITVLAVHGNGGGAHRFSLVSPWMPRDVVFRPVTLPGFADVPPDASLTSLADYARSLLTLLRQEPRPRVVLGHGIGGSIALELVQEYASELDGLILHAPVGARLDRRWFPRFMAVPGMRDLGRRVFAARAFRPVLRRLLFSRAVPGAYVDRFFDEYGQCSVFSQMFDLISVAWFRGLRPVRLPAALLWGEDERILAVDHLQEFQALLPLASIHRVPGWGHFPMAEAPAAYAAKIAALARLLADRTADWSDPRLTNGRTGRTDVEIVAAGGRP